MRAFRPKFHEVAQQQGWWWGGNLSAEARLVWLAAVGFACSAGHDGVFQVAPAGLCNAAGLPPDHETGERAIAELLGAGAIEPVEIPSQRWVYRLVNFQALADALDTRGAAIRAAYRRKKTQASA